MRGAALFVLEVTVLFLMWAIIFDDRHDMADSLLIVSCTLLIVILLPKKEK